MAVRLTARIRWTLCALAILGLGLMLAFLLRGHARSAGGAGFDLPRERAAARARLDAATAQRAQAIAAVMPLEPASEAEDAGWYAGRVIDDVGVGIAGAEVVIAPNQTGMAGPNSPLTVRAITDELGRFGVHQKFHGTVMASAHAPGACGRQEQAFRVLTKPKRDLVFVLVRCAQISGTVTSASGAPLPDTEILVDLDQSREMWIYDGDATTDAAGRYTLTAVPITPLVVKARHAAHVDRQVDVEVRAGDALVVDFVLEPGLGLTGVVVDERGNPWAEAQVTVQPNFRVRGYRAPRTVTSDSTGRFEVSGLESGSYRLQAMHEDGYGMIGAGAGGFALLPDASDVRLVLVRGATLSGTVLFPDRRPAPWALLLGGSRPIASDELGRFTCRGCRPGVELTARCQGYLAAGQGPFDATPGSTQEGIEIVLQEGQSIRGRVVDTAGVPVPDILVQCLPQKARHGGAMVVQTTSGAAGEFELVGLPPPGGVPHILMAVTEAITVNSRDLMEVPSGTSDVEIVLDLRGLRVVEEDEAPLDSWVAGRVVDSRGAAVPGVLVTAATEGGRGGLSGLTDAQGAFRIACPSDVALRVGVHRAVPVPAQAGDEDIELVHDPAPSLVGRVRSADGSTPSTCHADLAQRQGERLQPYGGQEQILLDDGMFRIEGITRMEAVLVLWHPQHGRALAPFVIPSGTRTHDLGELVFEPPVTVSGVVLRDGEPVAHARISVGLMGETLSTQANDEGAWSLDGLFPGPHIFRVTSPSGARASQGVIVGADGTRDVRIEFFGTGWLHRRPAPPPRPATSIPAALGGRVLAPEGSELEGLSVWVDSEADGTSARVVLEARTDATGSFVLPEIAPGSYRVRAGSEGLGYSSSMPVVLAAGETRNVDLVIDAAASVQVEVVDAQGLIYAGALRLFCTELGSGRRIEPSDIVNGLATFTHVPSGRVRVVAVPEGRAMKATVIDVPDGGQARATIVLDESHGRLAVTVARGGAPLPLARVEVTDRDGHLIYTYAERPAAFAVADGNGEVVIPYLPPGDVIVRARSPNLAQQAETEAVVPGDGGVAAVRIKRSP